MEIPHGDVDRFVSVLRVLTEEVSAERARGRRRLWIREERRGRRRGGGGAVAAAAAARVQPPHDDAAALGDDRGGVPPRGHLHDVDVRAGSGQRAAGDDAGDAGAARAAAATAISGYRVRAPRVLARARAAAAVLDAPRAGRRDADDALAAELPAVVEPESERPPVVRRRGGVVPPGGDVDESRRRRDTGPHTTAFAW